MNHFIVFLNNTINKHINSIGSKTINLKKQLKGTIIT